jgi:hypothetical protein
MKEHHAARVQEAPLSDQTQFIENCIPIVISIDKDAVKCDGNVGERIQAIAL